MIKAEVVGEVRVICIVCFEIDVDNEEAAALPCSTSSAIVCAVKPAKVVSSYKIFF